jgi:hypothetical protein
LEAWEIYYKYYNQSLGAGYCGGTAEFFARLLREQGLDAFTWNFGELSDYLTHVTTVVADNGLFYIFDPTFGSVFTDPETGNLLDVAGLLESGSFSAIEAQSETRDFILVSSEAAMIEGRRKRGAIVNCKRIPGTQNEVCKYPGFGIEQYLAMTSDALEANGFSADPFALVEMMKAGTFGIGNMENTDSMKAFARMLVEHGVPMIETEGGLSPYRLLETASEPLNP